MTHLLRFNAPEARTRRARLKAAGFVAAAILHLAGTAAASPPPRGVVIPGRSVGGVTLGASAAQVVEAWGTRRGVCRGCPEPTWYFNYRPFAPQGAAVTFRRGRVVAVFTIWSPSGWRTRDGVRLGDDVSRVTSRHPRLLRSECGGYYTLSLRAPRAVTDFYIRSERLWGFGLRRPGLPPCR